MNRSNAVSLAHGGVGGGGGGGGTPPAPEPKYTIRSHFGGLTATGSDDRRVAEQRAVALATEHPGQRIWLLKNGRPIRRDREWVTWTSGPVAAVQR